MGAAACGGQGFKGRAAVSVGRPIASGRQQHNSASCPPLPPLHVLPKCPKLNREFKRVNNTHPNVLLRSGQPPCPCARTVLAFRTTLERPPLP